METNDLDWFHGNAFPIEADPITPLEPTDPVDPVDPIDPAAPVDPKEPVNPSNPSVPATPPEGELFSEEIVEVFETFRDSGKIGLFEDRKITSVDDLVEVIDENVNYKVQESLKNIDSKWYSSKPLVFQEFAKVAELVGDNKDALYQYINTHKELEDIDQLDPKDISHAEKIVRSHLEKRGEPSKVIEAEIEDLKEKGLISSSAERYKPLLIEQKETEKANTVKQEQENIKNFYKIVEENEKIVTGFLSNPEIAGMKLKDEDKDIVYDNLTFNPELNGFKVFKTIENLQLQGKWDTLAKIILLAEKEERFDELYTNRLKTGIQREVRSILKFGTKKDDIKDTKPFLKNPKEETQESFNPWG
jgi:hypothetical protein